MPKHQNDRLQGTLDLLILKILARSGPLHGYAIAQRIQQATGEYLRIEEGSLYPALHRMEDEGWVRAEWGTSDTGREARFYSLTTEGRKELAREEQNWGRLTEGVRRVLRHA